MFYSLLGRIVWFAAKRYARRRVSHLSAPRPVLAGGVLTLALAVLVIVTRSQAN
jgi:hypothetical protein